MISENNLLSRLVSLVSAGAFPHTVIIEGAEAFVRKNIAENICAAFVCRQKNGEMPCLSCRDCKRAVSGEHPDMIFAEEFARLNYGNTKGTVSVEDSRRFKAEAYTVPYEADHKVFVFENAHRLNENVQNALLKVLEEPPSGVYFIFLVPSANMLLQTVRSRSAIFSAGNPGIEDSQKYIRELFPDADENTVRRTARIYASCDGLEPEKLDSKWLKSALSCADSFFTSGMLDSVCLSKNEFTQEELKLIFNVLAVGARDVMISGVATSYADGDGGVFLTQEQISACPFTAKNASELYSLFSTASLRLSENANPTAVLSYVAARV